MLSATSTQLVSLFVLATVASPEAWVLPPESTNVMREAVRGDTAGLKLSAALAADTVTVSATQDNVACSVTLVHPSASAEGRLLEGLNARLQAKPCPWRDDFAEVVGARLAKQTTPLPWRALRPVKNLLSTQEADRLNAALNEISYQIAAEDTSDAKAGLDALPSSLPARMALKRARLYQKLGDDKAAEGILGGLSKLPPALAHVKSLLTGTSPSAIVKTLEQAPKDGACAYTDLAEVLAALGHFQDARTVADWVLREAPDCESGWESALQRRLETRDFEGAMALVPGALDRFEDSPGVLGLVASAYHAAEQHKKATVILERLARLDPKDEGTIRVLLSAMLRDTNRRAEYKAELSARRTERPHDVLTQFLLGVIHHYENEFVESNALLVPLEQSMGHQSRWNIYRAMNEFNLGKVDEALALLERAAHKPLPDPDIFYCRAEILRDTDRQQAFLDLKRYMASDKEGYMANADKETRVERMMRDLTACLKDGRPTCESEWEHPRLRFHTDPTTTGSTDGQPREDWPPWALPVSISFILAMAAFFVHRRQTS